MEESPEIEHATTISRELRLALAAAAAAGAVIRQGLGKCHQVQQKDVGDLVSAIDLEAERVAIEVLRSDSPLPILSEELHPSIGKADEFWIVDPLDGSTAYLMGASSEYPSVLVALRQRGETTLGAGYFPLTSQWFYAQRGRGAYRNGKRLVCDSDERLAEVWVEMNQYGDRQWETEYFAQLRARLRSPSGARLVTSSPPNSGVAMRIATGQSGLAVAVHDNHPDRVKQAPWDIAAPQVIIEEAGGVFLNSQGQRANPFLAEPVIVARSLGLARQVIELGIPQPAAD